MKSKSLCVELYKVTSNFPEHEKYGITSQIRRASVSVPSNIAEGHGRSSDADFVRFLYMSFGSIKELETLIEISLELGFLKADTDLLAKLNEISKMIGSLISSLKADS